MRSPLDLLRGWHQLRYLRRRAAERGVRVVARGRVVAVRNGEKEIRASRANQVYAADLIDNFDYYFNVVVPRAENGLQVVDYSHPAMHTMLADRLPFWFPELAESMETTELYLRYARLEAGDVVFDLGAYAGGATYHFSREVGAEGHVYAFEPDPASYECLVRNVELHSMTNVTAERRGIWSHSGRVAFQAEGNMGSAVVEAAARTSDTTQTIDVVSLADYCAEKKITRVDFVKLDVEGSEAAILQSSGDFISNFRPPMVIEVHFVRGVRTDDEVTRALQRHGYRLEVVEQAGLPLPLIAASPD
jgi:FkbM family methyltransferase